MDNDAKQNMPLFHNFRQLDGAATANNESYRIKRRIFVCVRVCVIFENPTPGQTLHACVLKKKKAKNACSQNIRKTLYNGQNSTYSLLLYPRLTVKKRTLF